MTSFTSYLALTFLVAAASAVDLATVYTREEIGKIDASIAEDAVLNFTELLTKYGYPSEIHSVVTSDGYVLTLHRIPYGRECGPGKNKIPVLVMHGLFCSSDDYIIMGPRNGLGYILADQCYDVWLGNNRGNKYSRAHLNLNVKKGKFWEFSWHEMGAYDLPALVDYVLNATGQENLHYIGHSQGTTQLFIYGSLHPSHHGKIRSAHAMSPVAFMTNIKNPTVKLLAILHKPLHQIAGLVGINEFMPTCEFLNMIGSSVCKDSYPTLQAICTNVLFLVAGSQAALLNVTMLPAIIGHTPAGASTRQVVHYAQSILTDGFKQYDHGGIVNLIKYGSIAPPDYVLGNIKFPIAFYYGSNDALADVKDVERLGEILPNLIGKYRVPDSRFSHLDYLWARDVKSLLYNKLLNIMKRY